MMDTDTQEAFGLTFATWLNLAHNPEPVDFSPLRAAWLAGEDPGEYIGFTGLSEEGGAL